MAASSSTNGLPVQFQARTHLLSDPAPTHQQHASASTLAAAALAATAAIASPRQGLRNGSVIIQTLRHSTSLGSAGTVLRATAPAAAGCRLASTATTVAATSAACTSSTGAMALWSQLRRQLPLQPQLQRQQQQQQAARRLLGLPSLPSRTACTAAATAAASCACAVGAGAGAAAAAAAAVRGGGLAGRRGLLAAGGSPRAWLVRRMATQGAGGAAGGSAAPAAAPAPRGLLSRFRGRLGEALRLQLAAAWHTYGAAAYVAAVLGAVFVLWRTMRSVTNVFIAVNDRMAEYGIMALAASLVLLGVLYLRWRTAVNPAAVYRQAMMQLNTNPGVLEVMGAPLVGSPVRAYVVTGGGLYLSKKFRIKLRSRRIQMMFPLSGRDRKGLVSLEAKRKHGRYMWKLLAVDLGPELQQALPSGGSTGLSAAPPPRPAAAPPPAPEQQRVYVVGDLATYQRGGVLGELRAPFLKALSNSRSYDVEDELEDELDELDVPKPGGGVAKAAGSAVRSAWASAAAALKTPPHPAAATPSGAEGKPAAGASEGGEKAAPKPHASAAAAPLPPPSPSASSQGDSSTAPTTVAAATETSFWGRLRTVFSGPGEAK